MRRICMSAFSSLLAAGALSTSASADPYGLTYSPYPLSQPVQQPIYVMQPQMQAPASIQQYGGQPNYAYQPPQQYYNVGTRGIAAQSQNYPAPPPSYTGSVAPRYTPSTLPPQGYVTTPPQGYVAVSPQNYAQPEPSYTGTIAPRYASAAPAPATYAAAPQPAPPPVTYAAAAPPVQPPPPSTGRGFLESIFGGPTIPAHAYSPAQPEYQPAPPPPVVNQQQAYAPSSQGNMASYPIDPKYDRQVVDYRSSEAPGTIVIDTPNKFLYLVEGGGKALRYGIGVGRPGFTWAGVKTISAKREWPDWRPPDDMLQRRPDLPRYMPGGIDNPLGARAMYLGSTLYRIHGSNEPWTIGTNVSSGCIRMRNDDVSDLYNRVKIGTKVVVI
jgi:lipoprotein-anchoring transpeptidase ErfK/SrfK